MLPENAMRPFQTTKRCVAFLLLMLTALLPSQSAAAAADWEQLYPAYPTHGFNDIYVAGASSAFAVGNFGLISHYNGSAWSTMTSPVSDNLNAVWGRSANDVFAVGDNGTILRYNGSAWQAMDSTTSDNLHSVWGFATPGYPVYAGGRDGDILKYAGGTWSFMHTGLADGIWDAVIIYGIWGHSPTKLFAVGYRAGDNTEDIYLKSSDGVTWQRFTGPTGSDIPATVFPTAIWGVTDNLLYIGGDDGIYQLTDGTTWTQVLSDDIADIWGSAANNIWAVGDTIYRFNGTPPWNSSFVDAGLRNAPEDLPSISGSSAANVFAVGKAGRILRYQGSAWSSMTAVPDYPIHDIWSDGADSLCAVGENGLVIRYDGTNWKPMASATNEHLSAVCGWGNGHYLAAGMGGTVQYYNGSTWSLLTSGTTNGLNDVWCNAADSAFVVGANGTILNCGSGGCVPETTDGTTTDLHAVINSTLGSYAAGDGGVLLLKGGANTWSQVTPCPDSIRITDLWRGTAIWAVGYSSLTGHGFLYSYNGGTWNKRFETPDSLYLQKAAGNTFSELALVGYGGTYPYEGMVVDNNGTTVKTFAGYHLYAGRALSAIDLYVGGAQQEQASQWHGQILRYDGSAWTSMIETNSLTDIWGADLNSVFTVGYNGTILHYNGSTVQPMESNTSRSLKAVFAGETDGWASAAGWTGEMFSFDGSTWSLANSPPADGMNDLWGQGDTVYGVGYSGAILRSLDRGANWNTMTSPTTEHLYGVWGAAADGPVFASGADGTVLRYTGANWSQMVTNTNSSSIDFHGVWGSSATDVYAVGAYPSFLGSNESQIIHFDGNSWRESYYSYNILPPKYLTGVWGRSDRDIIAFGTPNLRKQCGRGWAEAKAGGIPPLQKGWGKADPDGNYHIFGITAYDSIYHYTIPAGEDCSSPWTLFLPAIITNKK
jgi:hypothetical protein